MPCSSCIALQILSFLKKKETKTYYVNIIPGDIDVGQHCSKRIFLTKRDPSNQVGHFNDFVVLGHLYPEIVKKIIGKLDTL